MKFDKKFVYLLVVALVISSVIIFIWTNSSKNTSEITGLVTKPVSQADINNMKSKVTADDFENKAPTFTLDSTVYYTPSYTDFGSWCSSKGCFNSKEDIVKAYPDSSTIHDCVYKRNANYCCIKNSDRGFMEDVLCQGSGVYDNKVYKAETIKNTPSESPSLKDFKRGKTSIGLDPISKWTVAVNSKKGTSCYIPYGTLMYIYFEKDNPWNGVYRAEDTGSAFGGKCKIDIYAGVGVSAKTEALKHVKNKAQVFILTDSLKYDPSFLGNQAIFSQRGDVSAIYKHSYEITKTTNTYDLMKQFVTSAVDECSEEQDKKICLDKQITDYESKGLKISESCLESDYPRTDKQYIEQSFKDGKIIRVGGLVSRKEQTTDASSGNIKKLQINDVKTNNPLIIEFPPDNLLIFKVWNDFKINDYVEFSYAKIEELNDDKVVLRIGDETKSEEEQKNQVIINPSYFTKDLLKETVKKMADCTTSTSDCLCNVDVPTFFKQLTFAENKISFDGKDYVDTNFKVYSQSSSNSQLIEKSDLQVFSQIIPAGKISFKKNVDGDLIAVSNIFTESNLQECVPERNHFLLCASTDDNEPLRFTLKI